MAAGHAENPQGPTATVSKPDLSKAHAVGLLPDLCQPQPLLHLAVPGEGESQQDIGSRLGRCQPPSHPASQLLAPPEPLTCGPLASSAAHQGEQAGASPASQVVAPATCQTCAQSHPLVRTPPGQGVGEKL